MLNYDDDDDDDDDDDVIVMYGYAVSGCRMVQLILSGHC